MKIFNKIYLFAVIPVITILDGCNPSVIPLKGNYAESSVEIVSTRSVDSTWLTITQLFSEKGLSIKKIDKWKGLITSTKSSFIPVYTFEYKNGSLVQPEAWIVLKEIFVNKKKWNPKDIFCKWNIQITGTGKGISTIKIDPIVICTYYPNRFTSMEEQGQSTGKLEELLRRALSVN